MNKTILIVGMIFVGGALFAGGFLFGQLNGQSGQANLMMAGNPGSMMAGDNMMMTGNNMMMGSNAGMMGGQHGSMTGSSDMMAGQHGNMMGGAGMMNGGMMNGHGDANMMGMMATFSRLSDVDPLTIEEVETAVSAYLATLEQDNLLVGEIMIFDNHAYAQILEAESGQGAFELLIDPATGNVYPEPGPNMMWNTEYGMMSGAAGMMGMMGSDMMNDHAGTMMGNGATQTNGEVTVTVEEAVSLAQEYLDAALPGTTADDHADPFPGYYTLHIERAGEVIGMLSVNGYSGEVFLHHWHGDFIEMVDIH